MGNSTALGLEGSEPHDKGIMERDGLKDGGRPSELAEEKPDESPPNPDPPQHDRDHAHFSEIFVRGHVWRLSLGTRLPNLKLSGVMWGLSLGTRLPNLKFVPSAVLEQTERQTDGNRPIRDDRVVNGDHTHLPDIRHRTRKRF